MSVNDRLPFTTKVYLVSFTWGTSHVARYCKFTSDVVISGQTYTAEPTIDIVAGQLTAKAKDNPWKVSMAGRSPLDTLARRYAHAPVTVTIAETPPDVTDGSQVRVLFKGTVTRTTKNKAGQDNLVEVEVSGIKSLIQYPLGLEAKPECNWRLGDTNCCVNLGPLTQTRVVASVTERSAVLTDLTTPVGDPQFWYRGYAEYDGLRITIFSSSGTTVVFEELPPPEWVGQSVLVVPGCDKKVGTCINRFNNEANFSGFGIAIPLYNPLTEDGGS